MSLDLAKKLIDFSSEVGANSALLIGGEPTLHNNFFEILNYLKEKNFKTVVVTNGYKFSDEKFIQKVEDLVDSVGFSIKAANKEQHKLLTKTDTFEQIKQAITNLTKIEKFRAGYSTVISRDTIDNMEEFAEMIAELSPKSWLKFSLCNPSISVTDVNKNFTVPHPELVQKVMSKWDKLCEILDGKVGIELAMPQCDWPKEFIDKLKSKNQVSFGCHLMSRNGLIFDTDAKILPCNSLTEFPIAEFGKEFSDKESFEKFWNNDEVKLLYKKFYELPKMECKGCETYSECGGGCPLKHF